MARLCQRAETDWVGVRCGIMDQMISAVGQADHALPIDCRSLETRPVATPAESAIVVMDTATRRRLVDSVYNERREQCQVAAEFFGIPDFRDVTVAHLQARGRDLDHILRRRARHVVTDNARTLLAAEAMERGDAQEVGCLMNASHASLRDDFEVSSRELDAMAICARQQDP